MSSFSPFGPRVRPDAVSDAVEDALVEFVLRREAEPELTPPAFAAALPAALRADFEREAAALLAADSRVRPAIPARVGRYRIVDLLGEGGTARVYAAEDEATGAPVAVKVLHAHVAGHAHARARLRREARIAAALRHPRLVRVLAHGEADGQVFLVMERVAGRSLQQHLRERRHPWFCDHRAIARSFAAVAEGMHAAHAHGHIHRDLKPGNLMLGDDGSLTVLDFGLSAAPDGDLTRTSDFFGTPAYMAPEQAGAEHDAIGPATDVYALGAVLYECVTGRPAVRAGALPRVLDAVRAGRIPAAHRVARVPRALSRVLSQSLARSPRHRYADAAGFAADLRAFAEGCEPVAARPRRARLWTVGALACAAACVALGVSACRSAAPASAPMAAPTLPRELFDLAQRGDAVSFERELQRVLRAARDRRD